MVSLSKPGGLIRPGAQWFSTGIACAVERQAKRSDGSHRRGGRGQEAQLLWFCGGVICKGSKAVECAPLWTVEQEDCTESGGEKRRKVGEHEDKGETPALCIKGVSYLMNTENEES